jgi:serine/threonine-protein kinase
MSLNDAAIQHIHKRIGSILRHKYRLDRLLGIGGMAAVFEATHRNGGRVALKVLHPDLARFPEVRTRFLREGYVANRIAHTGVVRILDDDEDIIEKTVFLVMELLDGETVQARRERFDGRLPLVETLDACERVLDVLVVAHEQGIVHRDVKPDNLFLTTRGELKVLDFGIARLLDGTGATGSGELLGTPAYMSPEQANGRIREIDARTDLWSVGAVLFTLITGAEVHEAATAAEQLICAATQPARLIESLAPWLERDLAAVANRALAFDRSVRWPSARAMQEALRATTSFAPCLRLRSSGSSPQPSANPALARTVDMPDRDTAATLPHGSRTARPSTGTVALDPRRRPGGRGEGTS